MAVKAGIGGVQRELSEVYVDVGGVNRKLEEWQCCVGNVNRDLLESTVDFRVTGPVYGSWMGAADGGEFTPSIGWNSKLGGMEFSAFYQAAAISCGTLVSCDEDLRGKMMQMTVVQIPSRGGDVNVSFGMQPMAEVALLNGTAMGISEPFRLEETKNIVLGLGAGGNIPDSVVISFQLI